MIQKLLDEIVSRLRAGLTGLVPAPASRITAGPLLPANAGVLPRIAVYPGEMTFGQQMADVGSSQPRPQPLREERAVDAGQGPYPLARTPLEKSLICKVIYDRGEISERRRLVVENKDFTVDYENARLEFQFDLTGASHLLLNYSYVGVFVLREYRHEFLIDIFDDQAGRREQIAALAAAVVLTNHDELIEYYNQTNPSQYTATSYGSLSTLSRLLILDGQPHLLEQSPYLRLRFRAEGQLRPLREITGGFGLIEKIHSPGRASDYPVDIEPEVE